VDGPGTHPFTGGDPKDDHRDQGTDHGSNGQPGGARQFPVRRRDRSYAGRCSWQQPSPEHVERPGHRHYHRKRKRHREHDEGEHALGQVQPVHDRLHDLQKRKGHDAVAGDCAKDATPLAFGDHGHACPLAEA
jgi:hypothetical protein